MIRREQQARGIGERHVVGEPLRVGVTVRTDDGQVFDELVQIARDGTRVRVGGKQPIGIELVHIGSIRARLTDNAFNPLRPATLILIDSGSKA